MIGIRIAGKKRWRQRKKDKKGVKRALQLAGSGQLRGKSPDAAEQQGAELCNIQEKSHDTAEQQEEKSPDPIQRPDKPSKKPGHKESIKEIDPSEIVRSEKSLGQGTFGMCYLAHYREILVVVKEFKPQESWSLERMKPEVFHEARMICHLGDHCGLPLLFGIITESVPLRLITQFHAMKRQSITLRKG